MFLKKLIGELKANFFVEFFPFFFHFWDGKAAVSVPVLFQKSSPSITVSRGEEVREAARFYSAVETSRMVCSLVSQVQQEKMTIVMHETRG